MKTIIASYLLLACLMGASFAAVCTTETCDGPVSMIYSSEGCESTPELSQLLANASMNSVCQNGWMARCENGYYTEVEFADSECTTISSSRSFKTGVCIYRPEIASSYIYLCSVNDTHSTAYSGANTTEPAFTPAAPVDCAGLNNCSDDFAYTTTHYDGEDCNPENATYSSGMKISAGFAFGVCFYSSSASANVRLSCGTSSVDVLYYQNGADCAGEYISSQSFSKLCRPTPHKKRSTLHHVSEITHCQVDGSSPHQSGEPATVPPPSSSNRVSSSIAAVLAAALLALLM